MHFLPRVLTALLLAVPLSAQTPAPAPSPPSATLTLEQAQQAARANSPAYLQTANNEAVAAAQVRSAYASLLPSVNTSIGAGFRQGRQQFFGGQAFGSTTDQLSSSYGFSADVQYDVASLLAPSQQRTNAAAVEGDVRSAQQTLRADVASQYLAVLAEEARATLQDTLLATAQVQLQLAEIRAAVGSATQLDVRTAQVAVGQQRVAILRARNAADTEKQRLFQLMGVTAPVNVRLTSEFPIDPPTVSLDDLLNMARSENPGLEAARLRERSTGMGVRAARGQYIPTLGFSASVGGFTNQFTDDNALMGQALGQKQSSCFREEEIRSIVGQPTDPARCSAIALTPQEESSVQAANRGFPFDFSRNPYELSMRVSLPLFNGLVREQRVQEAAAARSDARYAVRAEELRVAADVNIAYMTLATAYETVGIQVENARLARQALQLAEERYRVGASAFVDVSLARADFERAEAERITAFYDYHRAFAALEGAVGRPLR